jgi:hypothetical protein
LKEGLLFYMIFQLAIAGLIHFVLRGLILFIIAGLIVCAKVIAGLTRNLLNNKKNIT